MAASIEDDPGGGDDVGRAKWRGGGGSFILSREAGTGVCLARTGEQRVFGSVNCQGETNGTGTCGVGCGGGDIACGGGGSSSGLGLPVRRAIPSSPPPSYEHVLAENRLAAERALAAAAAAATAASSSASDCKGEAAAETEETVDGEKAAVAAGGAEAVATAAAPVAPRPVNTGPTEILHKSSKELYRAVAAQWGIACKMSDHCRCLDCQSRYFDCEYDQNQSDGGLGAGTPMFISEVMHGSACVIL